MYVGVLGLEPHFLFSSTTCRVHPDGILFTTRTYPSLSSIEGNEGHKVIYPGGISTSYPPAVQERFLRTIRGLEEVRDGGGDMVIKVVVMVLVRVILLLEMLVLSVMVMLVVACHSSSKRVLLLSSSPRIAHPTSDPNRALQLTTTRALAGGGAAAGLQCGVRLRRSSIAAPHSRGTCPSTWRCGSGTDTPESDVVLCNNTVKNDTCI